MSPDSIMPPQTEPEKILPSGPGIFSAPIFIGGPDRCGKTTLQAFLSSHPRIAIPVIGSNLWSYFYGRYGDLRQRQNFERCLRALLQYKHALYLKPDVERLRREFWQGEPSYARLFGLIHTHYAESEGKPRWGDQTGLVERYASHILKAYPDAKMVHMLRDPRDRYAASSAMWPNGKGKVGGAAARWLYSARLAARNQSRYPERYRILRFEDLVRDPERILKELCQFLGEEYTPEMLTMSASPGHREKLQSGLSDTSGQATLSERFIGIYRQELSTQDIVFLQHFTGRLMRRFGYQFEPVQFTAPEWLAYWVRHVPPNLARMLAWLFQEAINQKLPQIVGRKPSAHMILPNEHNATLVPREQG